MATIKLKGINRLSKALNRAIRIELSKVFRDKDLRLKVGDIIARDIKENYDGGKAAKSTRRTREYLERFNSTDSKYKRNRIKALFSGKLLDDLAKNVKGFPTELTFEVEQSEKLHPGYKTKKGTTKEKAFIAIQGYLLDLGYDYLQLSEKARKQIVKEIQNTFEKVFDI